MRSPIILVLLLSITVVNFVDRQTLSILSPQLRQIFHFTNADYGWIVACFQLGMTVAEFPMGILMDRIGTRLGFVIAVCWWSIATAGHAFGRSVRTFGALRFWMGTGEAGNYSGAMKVIARSFPAAERTLAIGIFNSGSMIGSMIAPPMIAALSHFYGWRTGFLVPALLGLAWAAAWWRWYRPATPSEQVNPLEPEDELSPKPRARDLIFTSQAWAVMLCRMISGPTMQFYWYWMPNYLASERKMSLLAIGALSWIPFLVGDAGSILGGWSADRLLKSGYSVYATRLLTISIGALLCLPGIGVVAAPNALWAIALMSIVIFGDTFFSANMFAAIGDLFPESAVGRVTGLTGLTGGIGGIIFPLLTGWLVDHYSFKPAFFISGFMPLAGGLLLFLLAPGMKPLNMSEFKLRRRA